MATHAGDILLSHEFQAFNCTCDKHWREMIHEYQEQHMNGLNAPAHLKAEDT
jgi:hypothetical protein